MLLSRAKSGGNDCQKEASFAAVEHTAGEGTHVVGGSHRLAIGASRANRDYVTAAGHRQLAIAGKHVAGLAYWAHDIVGVWMSMDVRF